MWKLYWHCKIRFAWFPWFPCRRCLNSIFYKVHLFADRHIFVYCPCKDNFLMKAITLAEGMLKRRRPLIKLPLCDVVTMLGLRCHNVATASPFNVATAFSTAIGEIFITNKLKMSIHSIVRCNGELRLPRFKTSTGQLGLP